MYLSPVELMPSLAPYRPVLVLSLLGLPAALMSGVLHRFSFTAPQMWLLAGFAGALSLSLVFQGWLGGAVKALEEFGPALASFLVVAVAVGTSRRQRVFGATLLAIGLYLTVQGALAYHFGFREEQFVLLAPQLTEEGEVARTLKRIRGPGFLNDPNDLAQYLLIALALAGGFWRSGRWARNALLVGLPALWLLYGIFLTRSRGAVVGLAVLIALAMRDRLGKTGAWVMSGAIGLGLTAANFGGARALSMREGSIAGRLEAWSAGLQMLKSSPLFGVGFRNFTDHHELTAHNSFVLCFAETGMLGYFFWLGMLAATARDLGILARLSPVDAAQGEARRWARTVRLALYTFLATSWFLSRTYIPTLYLLIAIGVGLREIARQRGWVRLPGLNLRWLATTIGLQFASVALIYLTVRLRWL